MSRPTTSPVLDSYRVNATITFPNMTVQLSGRPEAIAQAIRALQNEKSILPEQNEKFIPQQKLDNFNGSKHEPVVVVDVKSEKYGSNLNNASDDACNKFFEFDVKNVVVAAHDNINVIDKDVNIIIDDVEKAAEKAAIDEAEKKEAEKKAAEQAAADKAAAKKAAAEKVAAEKAAAEKVAAEKAAAEKVAAEKAAADKAAAKKAAAEKVAAEKVAAEKAAAEKVAAEKAAAEKVAAEKVSAQPKNTEQRDIVHITCANTAANKKSDDADANYHYNDQHYASAACATKPDCPRMNCAFYYDPAHHDIYNCTSGRMCNFGWNCTYAKEGHIIKVLINGVHEDAFLPPEAHDIIPFCGNCFTNKKPCGKSNTEDLQHYDPPPPILLNKTDFPVLGTSENPISASNIIQQRIEIKTETPDVDIDAKANKIWGRIQETRNYMEDKCPYFMKCTNKHCDAGLHLTMKEGYSLCKFPVQCNNILCTSLHTRQRIPPKSIDHIKFVLTAQQQNQQYCRFCANNACKNKDNVDYVHFTQ